jgi:hypothetical protein
MSIGAGRVNEIVFIGATEMRLDMLRMYCRPSLSQSGDEHEEQE